MDQPVIDIKWEFPTDELAQKFFQLPGNWGPPVFGEGPLDAKIVVVGEAPGLEEVRNNRPFVGDAGIFLDQTLSIVKADRSSFRITNVLKRRPTNSDGSNRTPTEDEIEFWRYGLLYELEQIHPDYVLLLGGVALRALYPDVKLITKARGEFREHKLGFKVFPTYHPAAILRRREWEPIFTSDLKKFFEVAYGRPPEKDVRSHRLISSVEALQQLYEYLQTQKEFSFDLETRSLDWMTEPILCVAIAPHVGEAYIVPLVGDSISDPNSQGEPRAFWSSEDYSPVYVLLEKIFRLSVSKGGQNAGFDVKFLEHNGIPVSHLDFDTLIEHHIVNENAPHGLAFLVSNLLGRTAHSDVRLKNKTDTFDMIPEKDLWRRAASDADDTQEVHELLIDVIKRDMPKAYETYRDILIPLQHSLSRMERRGVLVDTQTLDNVRFEANTQAEKLEREIQEEVKAFLRETYLQLQAFIKDNSSYQQGEEYLITLKTLERFSGDFNPDSPKQLQELFFVLKDYKFLHLTPKGRASVDEETLNFLVEEYNDPIAQKLLARRELTKLISTFLDGIKERLGPDGRIHPHYLVTGTVTWRLSCREPNLQNIPGDKEKGSLPDKARNIFIAPPRYVFVGGDYKQIEMLVLGALAQETKILDLYSQGQDLHKLVAAAVLGIPPEKVTKELRSIIKTIVFGLNYGRGVPSIAKQLKIDYKVADKYVNMYFNTFPGIKPWRVKTQAFARANGYVEGAFGLRRHLSYGNAPENVAAENDRQAINMPVQNGGALITNRALVELNQMYDRGEITAIPTMQLHDAIYFYMPESTWQEQLAIVRSVMERPVPQLGGVVPRVSFSVGRYWEDHSLLNEG